MQIEEIRSPELFQRLVRKLFTSELGTDYRLVDDSGGDGGLDGYDKKRKHLHAIYCPKKPNSADFRRKFKSDLEKVKTLRDEKGYDINVFVFITPQPLREPEIRELRDKAFDYGFLDGISLSNEYLETLFRKHPEIVDDFPELNYPRIEQELHQINETLRSLKRLQKDAKEQPIEPVTEHQKKYEATTEHSIWLFGNMDVPALLALQERLSTGEQSVLAELTTYRMRETEPKNILLAMSILQDYHFGQGDMEASEGVSREAISLAKGHGLLAHEAYFHAMTARTLSQKTSELDLGSLHRIRLSNMTGIQFITQEEKKSKIETMHELKRQAQEEISTALVQASRARNLETLWHVLFQFALKESILAYPHYTINHYDEIDYALRVTRSVFERLFTIAPYFGQEMVVRTFFGYSSILHTFGKLSEALAYLNQGLAIAEKDGLENLLGYGQKMQQDIESEKNLKKTNGEST